MLIALAGCGDSPLLNHDDLGDHIGRSIGAQTGLSFKSIGADFEIQWKSGCPNLSEDCTFNLLFAKALPEHVEVEALLWMPSMGHGSSPITAFENTEQAWTFSDVYFIMPGVWQLKLKLKLSDGSLDEVVLDYSL